MKLLLLVEMQSLVQTTLKNATNEAYARGYKLTYGVEFYKGKDKLILDDEKTTSEYYVLNLFVVNKEPVIKEKYNIYTNFYPVVKLGTPEQIELFGYKELITNGLISLFNISLANYVEREKVIIKQLADNKFKQEAISKIIKPITDIIV
jgi:hypothetical protein